MNGFISLFNIFKKVFFKSLSLNYLQIDTGSKINRSIFLLLFFLFISSLTTPHI